MLADPEVTRIVRSWLRTNEHESADRVLSDVLAVLDATPQRRPSRPVRRIAEMNGYAKSVVAIAAVVAFAVVGFNLLPAASGVGGGTATLSPSSSPTPTHNQSPSPSAAPSEPAVLATALPIGYLPAGPHAVALRLCDPMGQPCRPDVVRFSFDLPSTDWRSMDDADIETGVYPDTFAWIWFHGPIGSVSTDPCAGLSSPVAPSVAEIANAVTTIGGTDATGPTDVTVGGRAAKLVELTIHDDIACDRTLFWLFGDGSVYPNTLESSIRIWILDVHGSPFVVYSDQATPNAELEQEISQIVDSIAFE